MLKQFIFRTHYRDIRSSIRPAGRRALCRTLLSAGAMALSAAVSGQALADWGVSYISQLDPVAIEVASDGENYTTVSAVSPAVKGKMEMHLDAQTFGRVKSWALWPKIKSPRMPWQQFQDLDYSKSYPIGDRPKKVFRDLPFSIPLQSYKTYVKQACNEMASDMRVSSGMSDEEIFSVDREAFFEIDTAITWEMSGLATEVVPVLPTAPVLSKTIIIKCKKAPPIPAVVTSSTLDVQGYDPVNVGVKCQMNLNGSISSNIPNVKVSFRYVDGTGKVSELKSVTTNSNKTANFEHKYPLSPGHKTGKVRMVGENLSFTSNWKNYDFDCSAEPANDLLTLLPPQATLLEVGAMAPEFQHRGHICPVKAKMIGGYKGRGSVSGKAVLAAKGQPRVMKSYSIEDGETKYVDGEFVLPWQSVQGPLRQTISFELIILNANGTQVDYMQRSVNFTCRKNPALGKLDGGGTTRPSREPQRKAVVAGPAPDFSILSPRRFARNGVIRLAGAGQNQVFKLTFLRKSKAGYKRFDSSSLPKKMTGAKARFNVRALEAGTWRLKVCATGAKKVVAGPKTCKHSDFKLQRKKLPGTNDLRKRSYRVPPGIEG